MSHPKDRQILAGIGNRYVVFGSAATRPGRKMLGPEDVEGRLPRVGDERDQLALRLASSLVVEGARVRATADEAFGDIVLEEPNGERTLVEIRAGDRDFTGLDLRRAWSHLAEDAEIAGLRREIWGFNVERLKLGIVWSEGPLSPRFERLDPLDVWEFNADASVLDRRQVSHRVDDGVARIDALYADVESWAGSGGLKVERIRSVPVSGELMQRFAIPDRDLSILDVVRGGDPILSLVPVGLRGSGTSGRIDAITARGTWRLVDQACAPDAPRWVLVDPKDRDAAQAWGLASFRELLGLVSAGE